MFKANSIEEVYKLGHKLQDDEILDYYKQLALNGHKDFFLRNEETNNPTVYLKTVDGKDIFLGRVKRNVNPRTEAIEQQTESVEPQTSKGLMARSKAIGSEFAPVYTEENIGDMFVDVAKFGLDNFAAIAKGGTQEAIGLSGAPRDVYNILQNAIVDLAEFVREGEKDEEGKPIPSQFKPEKFKSVMNNVGKGIFYFMGIDPTNQNIINKILQSAPNSTQVKEFFDKQNWASLMQKDNPFEGLGELFLDFLVTKKATPKAKTVESIDDAQKTLQSMQTKPVKGKRNAKR